MKSVLISINPNWCELIASGKKTVEVRKTKPKLETPFKCYIYCTKGRGDCLWRWDGICYDTQFPDERPNRLDGKVIGEFVCDRITEYECSSDGHGQLATTCETCLTYDEIINYCNGNELYGWHISDLKIYDKPRELSEFKRVCDGNCQECKYAIWETQGWYHEPKIVDCKPITRPPQSWCYVESEDTE